MNAHNHYLYLNREGRWADFDWHGLDLREDGALCLSRLPAFEPSAMDGDLPAPDGPAGLAVGPDGAIYWTDGVQPFVFRIDPCTGQEGCVPCLGGAGDGPTQLRQPRGLVFDPIREAFLVADAGNDRIQLFDAATWQLRGLWSVPAPLALATDGQGNIYVATDGGAVLKIGITGAVEPFPPGPTPFQKPVAVAVTEFKEGTRVYLLDAASKEIWVFDAAGDLQDLVDLKKLVASEVELKPLGLAVAADAFYVGDNAGRKLRKYRMPDKQFVGVAFYDGPVAALLLMNGKKLLVNAGQGPPRHLLLDAGHVRRGLLWGGPFENPSGRPEQWHWLRARLDPLADGCHVQLWIYRTRNTNLTVKALSPPDSTATELPATQATDPPAYDQWLPAPVDAAEHLLRGYPEDVLFLAVTFHGEGRSSPVLHQMRLDFDHETLLQHLPALYQEDDSRFFTARLLTLFESIYDKAHQEITRLPRYTDPQATPEEALSWLAGWLGLEPPETWGEGRTRNAIAAAFEAAGRRGTPTGLRRALHDATGVDAFIEEPIAAATWWVLPAEGDAEGSRLGWGTMLAGSEPQGAVLGSTAILDQSKLIEGDDFGAALFDDVAHRFVVRVRRRPGDSTASWQALHEVIEREKPAHTAYELCVIPPQMRVGFQARIGIDTIVSAPPEPQGLGEGSLMLAGAEPGRLGVSSELGKSTRLG